MKTTSQKDDNIKGKNETILMEKANAKMKSSKSQKGINHRIFVRLSTVSI